MTNNEIIKELTRQTYSDELNWSCVAPHEYELLIFNFNFVFKTFTTEYSNHGASFRLLFVEKKYPDQHSDYAGFAELYFPEIIIIKNNVAVGTINENNADKDILIGLGSAIDSNNSGMNEFRSMF